MTSSRFVEQILADYWITECYRKGLPKNQIWYFKCSKWVMCISRVVIVIQSRSWLVWPIFKAASIPHFTFAWSSNQSYNSNVSSKNIKSWFIDIETYLKSENYLVILNDPIAVFIMAMKQIFCYVPRQRP